MRSIDCIHHFRLVAIWTDTYKSFFHLFWYEWICVQRFFYQLWKNKIELWIQLLLYFESQLIYDYHCSFTQCRPQTFTQLHYVRNQCFGCTSNKQVWVMKNNSPHFDESFVWNLPIIWFELCHDYFQFLTRVIEGKKTIFIGIVCGW